MSQHTSHLVRVARRLALGAVAGALTVALLPTQALAADDSVTITSPADGETVSLYGDWETPTVAEQPLVVTFVAAGTPTTCALDDQEPAPCTSPMVFEDVVAGGHQVTVTAGSASQTNTFTVDVNAVLLGPPPLLPPIVDGPYFPASVSARWTVGERRTWVRVLKLRHMPRHVRVHVRCKGAGCPSPHRFTRRASGHLDLTPYFRGHGLRPGTRIVIRVTKSGHQLVTFRYTMRQGLRPALTIW